MELAQLIKTPSKTEMDPREQIDILFAASEVAPFSKTGGLGDVAASLPKAIVGQGHRVSVITPLYGHLDPTDMHLSRRLTKLSVPRKGKVQNKVEATVWETRNIEGVRIFFIEQDEFFGRDGIYGYDGDEFDDNAARFSFFSRAIIEFAIQMSVPVDVIHCNDWHTALAPVYRDHYYEDELADTSVVLTIHNLAYQGKFDGELMDQTGLPKKFYKESELRDGDDINFLKGGIRHADTITTVSPTFADEITTEEGGFGLHGLFEERADDLHGVLNGADYSIWSPENDTHLDVQYDIEGLNGKRRNKAELQHKFKLPIRPTMPLLSFIGRLADQKGLDILIPAVRELLESIESEREGFQLLFLGEGDEGFAKQLRELEEDFPKRVGVHVGYSEDLAHKFQAGSDMLLIPSKYEPCGLTQLYAMRYGTLPIVHATGGLADTVSDPGDDDSLSSGFVFHDYTTDALRQTITRACKRYSNYRKWRPLMETAMKQDFSWNESARKYADIYELSSKNRNSETDDE